MNLMVVLVPFLLMTAVFSHLTVLELNLPSPEASSSTNKKPAFDLKVVLRKDSISVLNGSSIVKNIPLHKGQHNFPYLGQVLKQVKASYEDKTAITLLSEADMPYEILVQAMDASRSFFTFQNGNIIEAELFPEISIGDAPRK